MIWAFLFLLAGQTLQAAATPNSVIVSNEVAIVSARIDLILDDSRVSQVDFQSKIREWERILNNGWNRHSYKLRGRKVRLNFHLRPAKDDSAADAHHVRVVFGQPTSEGLYAAYVQMSDNSFGPHGGVFPIQISPRTLIHEVGHLLNLDDEYVGAKVGDPLDPELSFNGVRLVPAELGVVVQGYRNVSYGPKPGESGVMGHHSHRVWDYYIERILRSLSSTGILP